MTTLTTRSRSGAPAKGQGPDASAPKTRKAMTIGTVAKILGQEFDDVSISKIRYLEDQKLLSPRRTAGGYRLYSQADLERLRTILRMQRDEFLPLRVIRQELASGEFGPGRREPGGTTKQAMAIKPDEEGTRLTVAEMIEETGVGEAFLRELHDFGILDGPAASGSRSYDETDVAIVQAANELASFGVGGRNLRVFRTSADREAALLQQILGASLTSRSPARREEALDHLGSLAGICGTLRQLLLVREVRELAGE